MTDFHLWHFVMLSTLTVLVWILPQRWQFDSVALGTLLFIGVFSPWAALILLFNCLLVYLIARQGYTQSAWVVLAVFIVMLEFVVLRFIQQAQSGLVTTITLIGLAYSSCRHIHYLVESYRGKIIADLRCLLHYQLFLPVIVTGPINRYPEFIRSLQRRRWDPADFSCALERIIYGYAKVVIVGNYVIDLKIRSSLQSAELSPAIKTWLTSLLDWAYLYAQFSGWSDIAIGFALAMGVKISENFNHPLKATNLVEFWQRWHISLSTWCKDYIFVPVVSVTRNPFIAVIAAMLVMGAWHELSLYYLLWSCYHALGIASCRLFQAQYHLFWPTPSHSAFKETEQRNCVGKKHKILNLIGKICGWSLTFFFIVSASPVINYVLEWIRHCA